MARYRLWLLCIPLMLLAGCEMPSAPAATTPATNETVAASPTAAGSSTIVPTRTVAGAVPTIAPPPVSSDSSYVDPLGRFTITIPKDWQWRAPSDSAGSVLATFDALDMQANLTITVDPVPLGTAARDFAASTEKAIASRMTNYKRQGQDSLAVGNVPAEALTYTGTVGNREYLFRQILLVQGTDGWSLTFPLDPSARQRYGPVIDAMTQSFAFGKPLAGTAIPTDGASSANVVRLPPTAVDWRASTPIAAGVPVRLPDADVVIQLNSAAFSTKTGSNATLGADQQFLIADVTIWNLSSDPVTPLPEQFSAMQEHGMATHAEMADIAGEVASDKLPICGKVAVAAKTGMRFAVVTRVPKQAALLLITYQPEATVAPQAAQFYVKP